MAQNCKEGLRHVQQVIFHALDLILWPLNQDNSAFRQEVLSLKKLDKGNCTWSTQKLILGWLIDTAALTITLPLHQAEQLKDILHSFPPSQKRTSIKKWHKLLGELRLMAIALPGA